MDTLILLFWFSIKVVTWYEICHQTIALRLKKKTKIKSAKETKLLHWNLLLTNEKNQNSKYVNLLADFIIFFFYLIYGKIFFIYFLKNHAFIRYIRSNKYIIYIIETWELTLTNFYLFLLFLFFISSLTPKIYNNL